MAGDGGRDEEDPGADDHPHVEGDAFLQSEGPQELGFLLSVIRHWSVPLWCAQVRRLCVKVKRKEKRGKLKGS